MPDLPKGDYKKVVIHDNFARLRDFARSRSQEHIADKGLAKFERYGVFWLEEVTFISTGMGCGQTNALVELLSKECCKVIVKVGTMSALHSGLNDGAVIVPAGALIDEGATAWINVREQHLNECFRNDTEVKNYIKGKKCVQADSCLRNALINYGKEKELNISALSNFQKCF